jgi:hypothetical protein
VIEENMRKKVIRDYSSVFENLYIIIEIFFGSIIFQFYILCGKGIRKIFKKNYIRMFQKCFLESKAKKLFV